MNKNKETHRYKELDALRGVAALMVVFFHFTIGKPEARLGFKLGTTGVDLFFIISGFVIFMSLTKVKNSRDFIINRVSRLYPTYWTCVTITFCIRLCIMSISRESTNSFKQLFIHYLGNLTMFQFYLNIPNLDGPYWTMIIEMLFYIGILFLYHFKLLKNLLTIGVILSFLIVVMNSFFLNYDLIKNILIWIPLFRFFPLFFAGIIFYKIYTSKSNLFLNYIILAICLICQILLFNYSGLPNKFIVHSEYAIMLTIYFTLFVLFVNAKINFIVSKGTLFLGKISFALYLIHQYISAQLIIPFFVKKMHLNLLFVSIFIALPIVILLATFITYYIEMPMSKLMKEKLRLLASTKNKIN